MAQRATIRDIAAAAHTSITAVSLTLSNKPNRLSKATRDLIREVANNLNYVPNQSARNLVGRQTMLLGLIVPDIEDAHFAEVAKCVSDKASRRGYTLIIANSNDSAEAEKRLLLQFEARSIDGVMVVPSIESFDSPSAFRSKISSLDTPVTLLDRIASLTWCDAVGFDNYKGGQSVAHYLLKKGHRNIGVIAASSKYLHKDGRIEGFLDVMRNEGAAVPDKNIVEGGLLYSGGYHVVESLLKNHVTAIFCGNDLMALGARKRLLELGLSIPADISLMGYNNSMAKQGVGADLTTINLDIPTMARLAMDTILHRIEDQNTLKHDQKQASKGAAGRTNHEPHGEPEYPWLSQPLQHIAFPTLLERTTVAQITKTSE